jgi:hypothetical protein
VSDPGVAKLPLDEVSELLALARRAMGASTEPERTALLARLIERLVGLVAELSPSRSAAG